MNNRINLIVRRMSNHAGPSGYDRLSEFIDDARIISPIEQWRLHQRIIGRVFRGLTRRSQSLWYHRESLLQELTAAASWLKGGKKLFHFLYGENCHRYLGLMKSISNHNKIIATYHTPREKFDWVVKNHEHLKRLDAAVVVSRSQADFFSEIIGSNKVHYIPHGIDTRYFKPLNKPKDPSKQIRCIFVGTHLRDFETLARAADILNQRSVRFCLKVVTFKKNHAFFKGVDNVECLDRISDEKLLTLYRDSHLLLLPLLESTANNTLLEAMACGLPIITTELLGIRDYISAECALLTPLQDPQSLADAVVMLYNDYDRLNRMAFASRKQAAQFSWPEVADRFKELYDSLFHVEN